jgi:hypothetical protein
MTEAGSNISEWPICEKRETQSKEKGKKENGTKKMNGAKKERLETKGK